MPIMGFFWEGETGGEQTQHKILFFFHIKVMKKFFAEIPKIWFLQVCRFLIYIEKYCTQNLILEAL